jgi:signal transduction histidine kinase
VEVSAVLETLRDAVSTAPYARNKKLTLEIDADDRRTLTRIDPALLNRVLVNMVKNAFEAIREGEVVRVRFHSDGNGTGIFSVYNRGTIPEDTQLRMFQRAFTTKGGIGRGFGTYGMKLLGENYLGGEVGFESTQDSTTRFYISLPSPGKATH